MAEQDMPVEGSKSNANGLTDAEGTETLPNKDEGSESTLDTSPDYVRRLRTEAADARVKLQRLNDYETKLFDAVAANEASKILRDASDFTPTDRAALLDDDGYPDREKINAAVTELIEAKPYLARVAGDVGQGARPEPEPAVSLGGMLRAAAQ